MYMCIKDLKYRLRNDLCICKSGNLESTFIELVQFDNETQNIAIGATYRHPSLDVSDFNNSYLHALLEKLSLENKQTFLSGDFNINLLRHDSRTDLLDNMFYGTLFPLIIN